MGNQLRMAVGVLLFGVAVSSAEPLFVSLLEIDGLSSARFQSEVFARTSSSPGIVDDVNAFFARHLVIPHQLWLAEDEVLRFIRTADADRELSPENPAVLAIAPIRKGGDYTRACAGAYRKKSVWGGYGTLYEDPVATNLPPRLAVAQEEHHLFLTPSPEQLDWGWKLRKRFLQAPRQNIPGTFRVLINVSRFSNLLPLLYPELTRYGSVMPLLGNFHMASFSITFNADCLGFAMRSIPMKGSSLEQIATAWNPPSTEQWRKLPEDHLFVSLTDSCPPTFLRNFSEGIYRGVLDPFSEIIPDAHYKGASTSLLVSTPKKDGFSFATISELAQTNLATFALSRLATEEPSTNGIEWLHFPSRQNSGLTIERYKLKMPNQETSGADTSDAALARMILLLFLDKAYMETTVADGHLIVSYGPDGALDDVLTAWRQRRKSTEDTGWSLQKNLELDDPCLRDGKLLAGISLRPIKWLRHAVSLLPGATSRFAEWIPEKGNGATIGLSLGADGVYTLSLRISNSEIDAFRKITDKRRPLLQEIFYCVFADQIRAIREKDEQTREKKKE
ncbi:MAG: hypothetical protein IJR99_02790 [Kiritimatiellae bacterium]|nr:hypothetical protein [Kiritimatiellia bacterium]